MKGNRRVRWTQEQAAARLEQWRESGLSLAQFASREKLGYERLRRWQGRLEARRAPVFAAVEVAAATQGRRSERIVIELACGMRLEMSEHVDPTVIARLARALECAAC
jgi:transposase